MFERRSGDSGTLDACSTSRATAVLSFIRVLSFTRKLHRCWDAHQDRHKSIGLLSFQLLTYGYHGLFRGIFTFIFYPDFSRSDSRLSVSRVS
jgi:hypothetical protein